MGQPFGTMTDGRQARLFTLANDQLALTVTDRGATLVSLLAPDRDGRRADIVLGFDDVAGYEAPSNPYMGATVGRVANRIAGGAFEIDGRRYTLARNEGANHLHGGGTRALDKVVWDVAERSADAVTFSYVSPDGEEGYPGQLQIQAQYRLEDDALHLVFTGRTDALTPVNLTNHAYYNLNGAGSGDILDHELVVHAGTYTPADEQLIPTGQFASVAGTPLDLQTSQQLRARVEALTSSPAGGIDHNYMLEGEAGVLRAAARLYAPASGRVLELSTDQPALQIYTGNGIADLAGKRGAVYGPFAGMCLETQQVPDAVNHDAFPSPLLAPGDEYVHHAVLRFSTDAG